MVKLVYCISKKVGMEDEEFFDYWKNVHARIGVRIPGLRRLAKPSPHSTRRQAPPDFDGMAELWFDNVEALLNATQSPEWKASTDDEANFIDHGKVALVELFHRHPFAPHRVQRLHQECSQQLLWRDRQSSNLGVQTLESRLRIRATDAPSANVSSTICRFSWTVRNCRLPVAPVGPLTGMSSVACVEVSISAPSGHDLYVSTSRE
jgi:uncharacterized protein (TIGR02118 family)